MRLCAIGFPVVGSNGSAAFQQLIANNIGSFTARQLAYKLDYRKREPLRSRFKLLFHSICCQIRNPQSKIRNSNDIREGLFHPAEIPDSEKEEEGDN